MEENCQKNMLKLNESINQEDEKMPLFLDNDNINNKEDLFQIYGVGGCKYFNEELGYFVYIKGNNIKRKKELY